MKTSATNLVDLLTQTEKWLLQEFADDQKLLDALTKGDTAKTQTFLTAVRQDEETLARVHAALLGAVTAWKTEFNVKFEATPFDQKFTLLEEGKPVVDHMKQLNSTYDQVRVAFQSISRFATTPTSERPDQFMKESLGLLARWRDGAHDLAREIGALETFENHLRKKLGDRVQYEMRLEDFVVDWSRDLGQGEMGEVFRAKHVKTGIEYALKRYKHRVSFDAERAGDLLSKAIERLVRVAHFNHESLIACKGFILQKVDSGKLQLFAVLPLALGEKLSSYFERKNWTESDIRRFYDIVGPAVQYMIDNGVVHSDLAPRNIMVAGTSGNEKYLLIDFENIQLIAKDVSRTNASADFYYSPVEVLLGRLQGETNTTIPFYALGEIGIRMAVGNEKTFEELHSIQSSDDYLFPTLVAKALETTCTPAFIQTVCMATLPDPKDRFPSWKLMHQALEKGVAGRSPLRRIVAAATIPFAALGNSFAAVAATLRGDRIIPKAPEYQIVASERSKDVRALPSASEKVDQAEIPTPPPLLPLNVVGIREEGSYFIIELDDVVYALEAERTDGGKSHRQDGWCTYFHERADGTHLPTPGDMLRIVVALQGQLALDPKEPVLLKLKAALLDDFKNYWMMTGARVRYTTNGKDAVIIGYRESDQREIDVKRYYGVNNWLAQLSDREVMAHALFDARPDDVDAVFAWLTGKKSYVWRLNKPYDEQRPVLLGLGGDDGRFYVDAGDDCVNWPTRGVALTRKNSP